MFIPNTPEEDSDGCDASSASTSSKMEEICVRRKMMQRLVAAQVSFPVPSVGGENVVYHRLTVSMQNNAGGLHEQGSFAP